MVERWKPEDDVYRRDVERSLRDRVPVLGCMRFDLDETRSVEEGARFLRASISQ